MEGYGSMEEYVQEYIDFFIWLQKGDEAEASAEEWLRALVRRERSTEIFLPAVYLREIYGLTDTEFFLVMLAFCCELEEGLCLHFWEKFQGQRPNLQYGMHLLSKVFPVDFALIAELSAGKGALSEILDVTPRWLGRDGGALDGMLCQPLFLNETAFHFLLTGELLTGELPMDMWGGAGYEICLAQGQGETEFLPIHETEYGELCKYLGREEPLCILLCGSRGSGRHTLLRRVCHKINLNLVFVKLPRMENCTGIQQYKLWQTVRLLCRLLDAVLALELEEEAQEGFPDSGERHLILLAQGEECIASVGRFADVQIDLQNSLSYEEKKLALASWLSPEERRPWQEELLKRYRLGIGELRQKQRSVSLYAEAQGVSPGNREAWIHGWTEKGRSSRMGRLIESAYRTEDIVLPDDCREQLDTVIRLAKGWEDGQGLSLLFHGSSGTGKTMAASILAKELGLSLFKVDLSQIYDKYIGETEKHLDEIFRAAGRCRYLLFFDEADTLFAKRTDIQDSHDRYANVSTAYLLQRIEEYEGILILATNLMDHFDDAFVRRIRFVIKFRNLDDRGRATLWEKALAGNLPVAGDVSFEELAQAAELSPARIRAAAQVAKLLAAGEGSETVTRRHLKDALELEAGKDETVVRGFAQTLPR